MLLKKPKPFPPRCPGTLANNVPVPVVTVPPAPPGEETTGAPVTVVLGPPPDAVQADAVARVVFPPAVPLFAPAAHAAPPIPTLPLKDDPT
jgi:hypothetical protein